MGRIAVTSSERVRYFVAKLLPWLVISEILLLHAVSSTSVVLSDWSILSQVEALCMEYSGSGGRASSPLFFPCVHFLVSKLIVCPLKV